MKKLTKFYLTFAIAVSVIAFWLTLARCANVHTLAKECKQPLYRVAHSDDFDSAIKDLATAQRYLERTNLINGSKAVLKGHQDKVDLVYKAIVVSKNDLLNAKRTQIKEERDRVLSKVKITLLDYDMLPDMLLYPYAIPRFIVEGIAYIDMIIVWTLFYQLYMKEKEEEDSLNKEEEEEEKK